MHYSCVEYIFEVMTHNSYMYCYFWCVFSVIYAGCTCNGAIYATLLSLSGLACLYSCYYRSKMRAQYELPEAPCMDCLVHFCCETCALCQEYRELKNRGFDLSIGNPFVIFFPLDLTFEQE